MRGEFNYRINLAIQWVSRSLSFSLKIILEVLERNACHLFLRLSHPFIAGDASNATKYSSLSLLLRSYLVLAGEVTYSLRRRCNSLHFKAVNYGQTALSVLVDWISMLPFEYGRELVMSLSSSILPPSKFGFPWARALDLNWHFLELGQIMIRVQSPPSIASPLLICWRVANPKIYFRMPVAVVERPIRLWIFRV